MHRVSSPKNKKEELVNAIYHFLARKGGSRVSTDRRGNKGKCLLSTLTDSLLVIDGYCQTLADRSYSVPAEFTYSVPAEFTCFSGYNVPEASKHKQKTLEYTAVEV